MKITDFDIRIHTENVLALVNCYPDSPVYEAVVADLEEILPEAYQKLLPKAVLEFGKISEDALVEDGTGDGKAIFCIETVGDEMSAWSAAFFEEGNYVKGMLADAIADDCLFQMDTIIGKMIEKMGRDKNYGVIKRLEAPQDISIEIQKKAWEVTRAEEEIGIRIKESFMLEPIKSSCQIYRIEEGCKEYRVEHTCENCSCEDCKMRHVEKISVEIKCREKSFSFEGRKNQTLLEALRNAGIHIDAICSGKGTCGKCKVRYCKGIPQPSKEERAFFHEKELEEGWRLACKARLSCDCTVIMEEAGEENFAVVTTYESGLEIVQENADDQYGLAADIGTTTIVIQLVELSLGKVVATYTTMNHQRIYGGDVISRIQASNEGRGDVLRRSILRDLENGIEKLLEETESSVEKMTISGNTTMIHLLMGYSCKGLGSYPFAPVNMDSIETDYKQLFGNEKRRFPVHIFAGISAYVGGDITAGLLACGFDKNEKVSMLIDLGTNGEMAIGNKDKILVTSTAAGPAFEGGNIACGTGSISGAISEARYTEEGFCVKTIGDHEPIGICGTGVIEITYELLKQHLVDETGLLKEEYFDDGVRIAGNKEKEIRFYQKDIREIQLAKAAIRAGMETLLLLYGVSYEELENVYIAGGFGYKINIEKAAGIGLLPEKYKEKIKAVGNSSLKGSVMDLIERNAGERAKRIVNLAEEIELALCPEFHDLYIENMYFKR